MKLDSEEDRGLLLQIIQNSNVPGGAVMVIADLISRIRSAGVEEKEADEPA